VIGEQRVVEVGAPEVAGSRGLLDHLVGSALPGSGMIGRRPKNERYLKTAE